jgi:FkbM family methyltransferase
VRVDRLLSALEDPAIWRAALTWPKFSLASYRIVSGLKSLGIEPSTVIDVGANVGQFAVAAVKLFRRVRVLSIEPDPASAVSLRRNARGLPITVFGAAVGDKQGPAKFYVNRDSQVSSLLPLGSERRRDFPNSQVVSEISVEVQTLDALLQGEEMLTPVLLKIDAQGFEDRVITGASRLLRSIQWVVVEVAFGNLYEGEVDLPTIAASLREHDFVLARPLDFHRSPRTGQIIEMDALFARRDAAVGV